MPISKNYTWYTNSPLNYINFNSKFDRAMRKLAYHKPQYTAKTMYNIQKEDKKKHGGSKGRGVGG